MTTKNFSDVFRISPENIRKALSDAGLKFSLQAEITQEIISKLISERPKWPEKYGISAGWLENSATITLQNAETTKTGFTKKLVQGKVKNSAKTFSVPDSHVFPANISPEISAFSKIISGINSVRSVVLRPIFVAQTILYTHSVLMVTHLNDIYPTGNSGLILGLMAAMFLHTCVRICCDGSLNRTSLIATRVSLFIFAASGWVHFLGFQRSEGTPEMMYTNIGLAFFVVFMAFISLFFIMDIKAE